MNPQNLTLVIAFIAGFISFISPCVLPLVPAYVGYMGGRVTNTVAAQVAVGAGGGRAVVRPSLNMRFTTIMHGLFFVAGFTFVFITIGLLSTAFIQQIGGRNINLVTSIIGRLGGVLIIFFGLHFSGILPSIFNRLMARQSLLNSPFISPVMALLGTALILWGFTGTLAFSLTTTTPTTAGEVVQANWPAYIALVMVVVYLLWLILGGAFLRPAAFWTRVIGALQAMLYTDTRRQMAAKGGQGYAGSALMGVIFSAGWTPCIGPVYGTILTLAANTGEVGRATILLAAYSMGLGLPFLITAGLLDSAQGLLRRMQRQMKIIELASGAFLIVIGFLVASNSLQSLSQSLSGQFADVAINTENNVISSLTGQNNAAPTAIAPTPKPALNTITGAAGAVEGATPGIDKGNIALDFETQTSDGQAIRLADFRGKVVILNFWATWCGPCRVEMPAFQAAYEKDGEKNFTILAVNNQESLEKVTEFRQQLGFTFPMLMDEKGTIQQQYGVISYPTTLVINREGMIITRHPGALTEDQIQELLTQAMS